MESTGLDKLHLRYNAMRSLAPQQSAVREAMQKGLGLMIAQIFVKHQMHRAYQLCLLHRHHDLPTGCAMVYTHAEPDKYTCRMQAIGLGKIFPCSYHLSNGRFLPFEFSSVSPKLVPSDEFCSELAAVLQKHELDREVGITKALPPEYLWKEELSVTGMINTIAAPEDMVTDENYNITQWSFKETSAGLEIKVLKICEETPAGHKRIANE